MARFSRIAMGFRPLILVAVLLLVFTVMPRSGTADAVDSPIANIEISAAFDGRPMTVDQHVPQEHCHAPAGCAFSVLAEAGGGFDDRHGAAWLATPDAVQQGLRPTPLRHPPKRV